MSEEIWELEKDYCQEGNIHSVCLRCRFACKTDYKHWSGCMPDDEYCKHFKEHPFWIRLWEFYAKGEKANLDE